MWSDMRARPYVSLHDVNRSDRDTVHYMPILEFQKFAEGVDDYRNMSLERLSRADFVKQTINRP